jgi:hypothetical protein
VTRAELATLEYRWHRAESEKESEKGAHAMRIASKEDDGPRRAKIEGICAGFDRMAEEVIVTSIAEEWTVPDLIEVTSSLVKALHRISTEMQRRISVGNT